MTPRQEIALNRVRALFDDARTILDDVMYRSDALNKEEFSKVRSAYDLLCSANDKL